MIDNIIFDLGGVLIDWNPEHPYKKIIPDADKRKFFLENICTQEWNECQDEGRSLADGTKILVAKHPVYKSEIEAFYGRWDEMLGGPIQDTVNILVSLSQEKRYPLYALTNWSHETFPIARKKFDFLNLFNDIVVSGVEKMKKPSHRFYQLLLDKHQLAPDKTLFIDDNLRNIEAAREVGLQAVHYSGPGYLEELLKKTYAINF